MYDFTQNNTSMGSLSRRKLIYGVGINNAGYMTKHIIDGKQLCCPYYRRWKNMLMRCYSASYQKKNHTYKGCSVSEEWLLFTNFREWMVTQDWEGLELDKDIKFKYNKVYSSETCLFISKPLNQLLCDSASIRGRYPIGVCFDKSRNKFMAHIKYSGKRRNLGRYETSEEASEVYQIARMDKIQTLIDENTYPIATQYLQQHI